MQGGSFRKAAVAARPVASARFKSLGSEALLKSFYSLRDACRCAPGLSYAVFVSPLDRRQIISPSCPPARPGLRRSRSVYHQPPRNVAPQFQQRAVSIRFGCVISLNSIF